MTEEQWFNNNDKIRKWQNEKLWLLLGEQDELYKISTSHLNILNSRKRCFQWLTHTGMVGMVLIHISYKLLITSNCVRVGFSEIKQFSFLWQKELQSVNSLITDWRLSPFCSDKKKKRSLITKKKSSHWWSNFTIFLSDIFLVKCPDKSILTLWDP